MKLYLRAEAPPFAYDMSVIHPADILFVRTAGIVGAIISRKTNCRYTHTALCVDPEFAISALASGVRTHPISVYEGRPLRVGRVRGLTPHQAFDVLRWAQAHLGRSYDFVGLLGLGLFLLLPIPNILDRANRWWCSEFVWDAFYYGAGIKLTPDRPKFSRVTPADLFWSPKIDIIHNIIRRDEVWTGA